MLIMRKVAEAAGAGWFKEGGFNKWWPLNGKKYKPKVYTPEDIERIKQKYHVK